MIMLVGEGIDTALAVLLTRTTVSSLVVEATVEDKVTSRTIMLVGEGVGT